MTGATSSSPPGKKPSDRRARFTRSFAQSTYITAAWTWFLVLAGKAAEPILVVSVLYASVKLLPTLHFPPQLDAIVFVAQFIALDVGGLSLNKLAAQALKEGNDVGAKQARRLSIALVSVMLAGVIIAGLNQVVKLDEQVRTVIDTLFLMTRAILAVLYSRVIHALKEEDLFEKPPERGSEAQELVTEAIAALSLHLQTAQAEQSLRLGELLAAMHDMQAEMKVNQSAWLHALEQQCSLVVSEAGSETQQRTSGGTTRVPHKSVLAQGASSSEAPVSRRQVPHRLDRRETGEKGIDTLVWPLLDAGKTVRGIAAETGIPKATVGRSRLRWVAAPAVSTSHEETAGRSHEATHRPEGGPVS